MSLIRKHEEGLTEKTRPSEKDFQAEGIAGAEAQGFGQPAGLEC